MEMLGFDFAILFILNMAFLYFIAKFIARNGIHDWAFVFTRVNKSVGHVSKTSI